MHAVTAASSTDLLKYRQTGRQTDRQTDRQLDRQTGRQTDQPQLRLEDTIADDEVQFLQIRSGTLDSDSALHPSLLDLFHHVW